jgi:hypothetical protein
MGYLKAQTLWTCINVLELLDQSTTIWWFKVAEIYPFIVWKPEIWNLDVSRTILALESFLALRISGGGGNPQCSLTGGDTLVSVSVITWCFPFVCLCVTVSSYFFFSWYKDTNHIAVQTHPMTSSQLVTYVKTSFPNKVLFIVKRA